MCLFLWVGVCICLRVCHYVCEPIGVCLSVLHTCKCIQYTTACKRLGTPVKMSVSEHSESNTMDLLEPPARVLLSAGLFSNLFAVLLCLVLHLLDVCTVRKVVGKLANIAIKVSTFQEVLLVLAASR